LDFDGCKDTLSFEIACLFFACTGASYNEMKLTLTILLQLGGYCWLFISYFSGLLADIVTKSSVWSITWLSHFGLKLAKH